MRWTLLWLLVGCHASAPGPAPSDPPPPPAARAPRAPDPAAASPAPAPELPTAKTAERARLAIRLGKGPSRIELTCTSDHAELTTNELQVWFGSLRCTPQTPGTTWELVIELPRLARWSDGLATCPLPDAGVTDADACATGGSCVYVSLRSFESGEQKRKIELDRARFALDAWTALEAPSLDAICGPFVHLAGSVTGKQNGTEVEVRFDVDAKTRR